VQIWPENLQVVNAFIAMSTQWRIGMGGATGLDYVALQSVMRLMAIPRNQWPEMFEDIRTLEEAALAEMHGRPEDNNG
jgi:Phage related hypothetical protein (DUF1799)